MTSGAYALVSRERGVAEGNIVHTEIHVCSVCCNRAQDLPRHIAWYLSNGGKIIMVRFRIGK